MVLGRRDVEHVFERLRSGTVPERGLDAFAVGIDRQRAEIARLLDLAKSGEGVFKFLRGGYGCGKTFMARLAVAEAQARNFATSFAVVSDNDFHLHRFDELYRKVMQELGTASCPRGALGDIVDRWIAGVEDAVAAGGADESAPDFDALVGKRLEGDLASLTGGKAPADMARALGSVFALKQGGMPSEAGALLSWLAGSQNVAASQKKLAGVKGDIASRDALDYLHGVVEIVKAAGYAGLVIIIDEAETILRMRQDVRGKSLNGLRQICDAAAQYHGLLWIFTGTPEFFDTKRGVAGLQPLHERIEFLSHSGVASPRQPQLELRPFDAARLREVAMKLRELFPSEHRQRVEARVTPAYVDALIQEVTTGFRGDVGVVPRQFLRRFVDVLGLVDEVEGFDPGAEMGFTPAAVTEDERRKLAGEPPYDAEPVDDAGYTVEM